MQGKRRIRSLGSPAARACLGDPKRPWARYFWYVFRLVSRHPAYNEPPSVVVAVGAAKIPYAEAHLKHGL